LPQKFKKRLLHRFLKFNSKVFILKVKEAALSIKAAFYLFWGLLTNTAKQAL